MVATVVAIGATAACSSSGSSPKSSSAPASGGSSSAGKSSATPSGTPIKIMTISPSGTNGANFPDIPTVFNAFAKATNAAGGIAGHPLTVEYCNDKNDPNDAAGCARRAVSDKVMAVVGTFTQFASSVIPVLSAAHIVDLANNAISADEFADPDSFPLTPGPLGFAAIAGKAGSECTKIDALAYDIPAVQGLFPFVAKGLAASKKTLDKSIKVPVTTTDFSSIVADAKGASCIVSLLPDSALNQYLATASGQGVTQKYFAPAGGIGSESLSRYKTQLEGSYTISSFPVPTDPVWAGLKKALAAAGKSSVDLVIPENLNAWVAGVVFATVAKTLTTFDATSFQTALKASAAVDTGGLTPPLNFAKPFPVKGLSQLFDTSLVGVTIKGGALVQNGTFVDAGAALK